MKYLPQLTILTTLLQFLLACTSQQSVIVNESTPSVVLSRVIATKTPQPAKSAMPTETPPAWLVRLRKTPSPPPVPSPTPTVVSASDDRLPTDNPSEAFLNLSEHQFPSDSPFVVMDEVVYLKVTMGEQVYHLKTVFGQETITDYCTPNMSGTKWLCMLSYSFFDNLQTRDEIEALLQSVGDDEEKLNLAIEELVTDYSMYPPVVIITSENDELIDFLPENEDPLQNPNWKSSCSWLSDDKVRCDIRHGTEAWTTTLFDLGKGAYIPLPENGDNIEIFGDYFLGYSMHPHPETILLYDQNHTQLYKFVALARYISDEVLVLVELSEDGLHYFHYIKLENGIIEDDVILNLSDYFPAGDDYDVSLTVEAGSYDVTICHDEIVCDKKIRISSDDIQVTEVFNP